MRFEISYRGQQAGWVIAQPDAHGILFRAESRVHTMAVLRLYGIAAGQPLLIGVLEPENGRLSLARRITPDVLRRAGVQQPPEVYYLEDGQPGCKPEQEETAAAEQPPEPNLSAQADAEAGAASQPPEPNLSAQADAEAGAASQPPEPNLFAQADAETEAASQPPAPNPSAQADLPPQCLQTGDALLDALIAAGKAECTKKGEMLLIRTPFLPGQQNPMHFALTACHLEDGNAVLPYKPAAR